MKSRRRCFRGTLLALIAIAAAVAPSARAERGVSLPNTTIYLVRHAEKQAVPPGDPPLTEAGRKRAAELARILGPLGIRTIFTSQFLRTRETARPLAEALGLTPIAVEMSPDKSAPGGIAERSIRDLVQKVLEHRGGVLFVVGHSNTLPLIIRSLGGTPVPDIPETEYDNLFVLTISGNGDVGLERRKF